MNRIRFILAALWSFPPASSAAPAQPLNLEEGFRHVPCADRPWVEWWWLNGNIDERTITRGRNQLEIDVVTRR